MRWRGIEIYLAANETDASAHRSFIPIGYIQSKRSIVLKAARLPGSALGTNLFQSIWGDAKRGFANRFGFPHLGTVRCVRGVRRHHALRRLVGDCACIIIVPTTAYGLCRRTRLSVASNQFRFDALADNGGRTFQSSHDAVERALILGG